MKRTIIFGGLVLLLHNIFTFAKKFEIDDAEVHVWEVHEYQVPPQSEEDPQELYLLNKLEVLHGERIPFHTHRTFILLKIQCIQWFISYWLGKETTIKHKSETAALTGELWHQIVTTPSTDSDWETKSCYNGLFYDIHINEEDSTLTPMTNAKPERTMNFEFIPLPRSNSIIPNITRETENNESDLFKTFFGKYGKLSPRTNKLQVPDLYEIDSENQEEILINLVPLGIEKKENNSYVLDEGNVISHSGEGDFKEILVFNLIYEKLPSNIKIKHMKYHSIDKRIDNLKRVSPKSKSYMGESSSARDTKARMENNKKLLFEVFTETRETEETEETEKTISVEPRQLNINSFNEVSCYVLRNETVNYFYIYIGTNCHLNTIKPLLKMAEKVNETQNFEKVIFSVNTYLKEPTAFWVNFEDYTDFANNSPILSNESCYNILSSIN